MKAISITILLIITTISCSCQEKKDSIQLNYKAQTRGFLYEIVLENSHLTINKNSISKEINLSKEQIEELQSLIATIDFNSIKSNISQDKLAVDRAILGEFNLEINNEQFQFQFDYGNEPIKIKELISKIERFTNLKE